MTTRIRRECGQSGIVSVVELGRRCKGVGKSIVGQESLAGRIFMFIDPVRC